jgi:hypothetical protein
MPRCGGRDSQKAGVAGSFPHNSGTWLTILRKRTLDPVHSTALASGVDKGPAHNGGYGRK